MTSTYYISPADCNNGIYTAVKNETEAPIVTRYNGSANEPLANNCFVKWVIFANEGKSCCLSDGGLVPNFSLQTVECFRRSCVDA